MKKLPNILTVIRFFLTVIFIFCLIRRDLLSSALAVFVFFLASLTDYYDGYFAKKHNSISNFGKIMDPIADKFLILAAFFIFARWQIIDAWMFYAILVREVAVTAMRFSAMNKGVYLSAEKAGKLKTVSQIIAVSLILVFILLLRIPSLSHTVYANKDFWLLGIRLTVLAAVFLTLFSGFSYFWNNRKTTGPA